MYPELWVDEAIVCSLKEHPFSPDVGRDLSMLTRVVSVLMSTKLTPLLPQDHYPVFSL